MILADTSAWVEFLRGSGHPVDRELTRLLDGDADVVVSEVVVMELLAGAQPGPELARLRSRLLAFPLLPLEGLFDYEEAAFLYRSCRSAGETLRSMSDCLIAVPALRAGAEVLHNDADFDVMARHVGLRVHTVPSAG